MEPLGPKNAKDAYPSKSGVLRDPWRPSKSARPPEERHNTTKNANSIDIGEVASFGPQPAPEERQPRELTLEALAGFERLKREPAKPRARGRR